MKTSSLEQLLTFEQRLERVELKKRLLLRFLAQEIFTSAEIAGVIMGLQTRQAVHKTLTQFEKENLIRRETITLSDLTKKTIWGITSNGLGWSIDPENNEVAKNRAFELSRVSGGVLQHTLDIQKIRILAERAGWIEWQAGDKMSKWQKNIKRPDAVARDNDGRLTAIEVERSFKSPKRYQAILAEYLQLIKVGTINRVVWVSPDEAFVARLKNIITSITEVPVAGQRIKIDPARHHGNLFFCDYKSFPTV